MIEDTSILVAHFVTLAIALWIVVTNTVACFSLTRCRRMELHIRTLSINLASTDILFGMILITGSFTRFADVTNDPTVCFFSLIAPRLLTLASMFIITLFALDRFASIYFSTTYLRHSSKRLSILSCCVIWISALIVTLLSYYGSGTGMFYIEDCIYENQAKGFIFLCVCGLVCFITVVVSYVGILVNVLQHVKKMKEMNLPSKSSTRIQFRSSFQIGMLVLIFFATYAPVGIYRSYVLIWNPEETKLHNVTRNITGAIFAMNSAVNPALYAFRFRECRLEMLKILCFFNRKKQSWIESEKKKICASYLNPTTGCQVDSGNNNAVVVSAN